MVVALLFVTGPAGSCQLHQCPHHPRLPYCADWRIHHYQITSAAICAQQLSLGSPAQIGGGQGTLRCLMTPPPTHTPTHTDSLLSLQVVTLLAQSCFTETPWHTLVQTGTALVYCAQSIGTSPRKVQSQHTLSTQCCSHMSICSSHTSDAGDSSSCEEAALHTIPALNTPAVSRHPHA